MRKYNVKGHPVLFREHSYNICEVLAGAVRTVLHDELCHIVNKRGNRRLIMSEDGLFAWVDKDDLIHVRRGVQCLKHS